MTVYIITGKLGSGKTLSAVGRIRDYLLQDRRVATNLDLRLDKLLPVTSTVVVDRVPDKPAKIHLDALGTGYDMSQGYDEQKSGLLVLDELGSWLNSRSWQDKERASVIDWFIHARKFGWDVLLIVQDVSIIDKQLRDTLCEHLVVCRRLDRLAVPLIGWLFKLFGFNPRLPRIHVASVFYGDNEQALRVDRWFYRGTDLYSAYDTAQVFVSDYIVIDGHQFDMRASFSVLSAWTLLGRYRQKRSFRSACITMLIWSYSRSTGLPVDVAVKRLIHHGVLATARRVSAGW